MVDDPPLNTAFRHGFTSFLIFYFSHADALVYEVQHSDTDRTQGSVKRPRESDRVTLRHVNKNN